MTASWPRPDVLPPAAQRLVVVEASAGTGKTYFLEHRVVDLVLAGAPLEQILIVTFTDKATAELRTRIRDLIDRVARAPDEVVPAVGSAWTIDQAARDRLAAALAGFDHAPIFTIHGFCQRVLIEDAFAARRLFEQTHVADEIAFDDAFDAVLREQLARDPAHVPLLRAYLEADNDVGRLHDLLLRCMRADAPVRAQVELGRVPAIARTLVVQLGDPVARARFLAALPLKSHAKTHVPRYVAAIGDRVVDLDLALPPARLLGAIDELRERADKALEHLGGLAIPPAAREAADAIRALAALPSIATATVAEFLPLVLARLGADKAERGLFDYADMLRLVADALRGRRGAELAARLRARMPWALIDEFQDTDKIQWEIFRTVWLHDDARGLTIVGDPKQAIYSFRGADVRTYLDAREALLAAGAHRVSLAVNRRSTAALVDAVNAVLAGDGFTPLLHGEIAYDTPVTAGGGVTCRGAGAPITVLELEATGKASVEAQRAALAAAIGHEVEQLRRAPSAWSKGDVAMPFALRQVMVLTRTNSEASEIATALRARGLPCALVESDKLFDTREAHDLAAVLAAIASPRDRSARLRALRSRFFDVPWHELTAVADAQDHHPAIARLLEWSALAAKRAYEALFRRLVEDSRFAERALVLGGGERAITNTWHVIELLLEEVARSRADLHELVARLRGWIADQAERTDDRDTQRAETDRDAIRVLTVHKAKGLEAPYVFLFGLASASPGSPIHTVRDADGRTIVIGSDDKTKDQRDREAREENQRLAYVALTRAQVRMYLPRYAGDRQPAPTSTYRGVQTCLIPVMAAAPAHFERVPVAVDAEGPPPAPADALAGFDAPSPPHVVALAPLEPARVGLTLLSYTRLAHAADAAKGVRGGAGAGGRGGLGVADELVADEIATEWRIGERIGDGAVVADGELPPGAASGLLLHDVLEVVEVAAARAVPDADTWATDRAVASALATAARARGVEPKFLPHAGRLVHRALTQPLDLGADGTLPPLADATALAREVEFAYPIPSASAWSGPARGLVKGFIDVLVAWGDELWVLDYKSDTLPAADHDAAARRVDDRYTIQTRLYALAAQRLAGKRRFAGILFAFVRYGIVVPVRAGADELAAWASWLAELEVA